jgi:GT2 family glycosyltransferase
MNPVGSPKVYIILLNYNGWRDTVECLESVLRNNYKNFQVIVGDNNSTNDSSYFIRLWLDGYYNILTKPDNKLKNLVFPPVEKPVSYKFSNLEDAENDMTESAAKPVILIQSGENLGFAGGNNIAVKYALKKNDFKYIWLLNNDTVIEPGALVHLVNRAETEKSGITGSKLLYYSNPEIINGTGGKHNKWLGTVTATGMLEKDRGQYDKADLQADYVLGASMLVSKEFIDDVGLMAEDYFLYYEEIDWARRAWLKGWKNSFEWRSRVYHKEGQSIGSNPDGAKRSELADYYQLRNRIKFTRKYYPNYLFIVYLGLLIVIFNRIRRKQFKQIKLVFKLLWETKQ